MASTVFVATETGSLEVDGVRYDIRAGVSRVREGHPMIDAHPAFFKPVEERVDYEWETADAPKRTRKSKPADDVEEAADAPKQRDPRRSED